MKPLQQFFVVGLSSISKQRQCLYVTQGWYSLCTGAYCQGASSFDQSPSPKPWFVWQKRWKIMSRRFYAPFPPLLRLQVNYYYRQPCYSLCTSAHCPHSWSCGPITLATDLWLVQKRGKIPKMNIYSPFSPFLRILVHYYHLQWWSYQWSEAYIHYWCPHTKYGS